MATTHRSNSAAIRARVNHPIIDSDGHTVEFEPAFLDYLRQVGGPTVVERYLTHRGKMAETALSPSQNRLSEEERRERRPLRYPWWTVPTKNTLDRATATLPRLLYERMEELGLDFSVLYPTAGLFFPHSGDEELRRASCRALNMFHADYFRAYADRMTPAAAIPMHTPQEAIEELEYAVEGLGMKATMMAGYVRRPVRAIARKNPEAARHALWLDTFGLDSEYNYDPVWAKCVELKVPPTFHSVSIGLGSRTSISNYMYNHIGHFAAAGDALCKSLFFGGVTRRFPTLKFAFLECGVGWGCSLYADLIGHWKKRNVQALENYNPANLNREQLLDLYRRYGDRLVQDHLGEAFTNLGPREGEGDPTLLDDWRQCGITKAEDFREAFAPHFYFGCEADDPMNARAFQGNPFGARLQAIFSSDIGHWDVPDMREVVEEAYELVEEKLITERDFRDFMFVNPVTLWTGMNPDFFKGTAIEKDVEKLLAEGVA